MSEDQDLGAYLLDSVLSYRDTPESTVPVVGLVQIVITKIKLCAGLITLHRWIDNLTLGSIDL